MRISSRLPQRRQNNHRIGHQIITCGVKINRADANAVNMKQQTGREREVFEAV